MAVSNNLTAALNFAALICSMPIIAAGIWIASRPGEECVRLVRWPLVALGVLVLLVALAGFVGAYWNVRFLLAVYLVAMAGLIVALLVLLVFGFVVTRPDGSRVGPGGGYREYRLDGYSSWLREHVVGGGSWGRVRRCLRASHVCGKVGRGYSVAQRMLLADLTPLQSGCCKPPIACGYTFVNPTLWINPSNPTADRDCYAWSNNQNQLCYNCNSCKAGLLGNLRSEWRKANIALIIAAVALIFVYVIGCSAYRNAQTEEIFRRYKRGYI